MSAAREALRELLAVMNEDKDGGWFICAEAADTIEAAQQAAETEPAPQAVEARAERLASALRMAAAFIESGESAGHDFFEVREAWRAALSD